MTTESFTPHATYSVFHWTLVQALAIASPMNPQNLVLHSLQAMRDVAPDHLQGFMSNVDTPI